MRGQLTCAISALLAAVLSMHVSAEETSPSALAAVEQAHEILWKNFVDKHGVVLDYQADLPTPEECAAAYPNGLGWSTPIANGAMFTGTYLVAQCERARRSGRQADREQATTLARGLLKLASVSEVRGMIVRGLGADGRCHYPLGSDDQTHPWFLGLHAYFMSGIPSEAEKREIAAKVREVAETLASNDWKCPCDGSFKGKWRGGFSGRGFRDSVRLVTMLKLVHRITGDPIWQARYERALREAPRSRAGQTDTRLQYIAAGYEPEADQYQKGVEPYWAWIYVGACCGLKVLAEVEEDPQIRTQYLHGLAACSRTAFPHIISNALKYDNHDTAIFGHSNWRGIYSIRQPQATIEDAVKAADAGDRNAMGQKFAHECATGRVPLACAVIAAQGGDPEYRKAIETALRHYDFNSVHASVLLVYAECAYYIPGEK